MENCFDFLRLCWESLLDIIFPAPSSCSACGRLLKEYNEVLLCPYCQEELNRLPGAYMEASEFLSTGAHKESISDGFDYIGAPYLYEGSARNMVRALKYKGRTYAARSMAQLMSRELKKIGLKSDIIVPVPAYGEKEKKRGYNQAELIARELSSIMGIPMRKALIKNRNTPSQVSLSEKERWENVRGAYALEGNVKGLSILLVDDVITTGATMYFSSHQLKRGGALNVISFSFTMTLQNK